MPVPDPSHPTVAALTRKGWAWEFLRRNPEYRQFYTDIGTFKESDRSMALRLRRWGLIFRGGSG
jgi:hypothetical protein